MGGFRFGVVATPRPGPGAGRSWLETVRRVAGLGYGSVLMPEGTRLPSPFPSLAAAAAVHDELRVGTFVAAAPLRAPRAAAWEAHSLATLTDGRFEFGIGTGLPHTAAQGAELLGTPELGAAQRLERVAATIVALRGLETGRTPVLVAAGGPRARELAAREADIVTIATAPDTPSAEVAVLVADVRRRAGDRAAAIEFAANTFVVGEQMPPEAARWAGVDAGRLAERDALTILPGDPAEAVDVLVRRRAEVGVSYVLVPEVFAATLAPAVARLVGT